MKLYPLPADALLNLADAHRRAAIAYPGDQAEHLGLAARYTDQAAIIEETAMKTIEVTIRLRVPDHVTDLQLAAINVVAAQAVTESALEYLDECVLCVTPLQDVTVLNGVTG